MFNNIGEKIKGLAKTICWIGIIFGIIIGFVIMSGASAISSGLSDFGVDSEIGAGGFLAGLIVMGIIGLISWLGSLVLYGFGELISLNQDIADDTNVQKQILVRMAERTLNSQPQRTPTPPPAPSAPPVQTPEVSEFRPPVSAAPTEDARPYSPDSTVFSERRE